MDAALAWVSLRAVLVLVGLVALVCVVVVVKGAMDLHDAD
jgi:hypothetical protein